jgi:hypothetical protein
MEIFHLEWKIRNLAISSGAAQTWSPVQKYDTLGQCCRACVPYNEDFKIFTFKSARSPGAYLSNNIRVRLTGPC